MIFITIFYKPFFINLHRFYIVLYFIYYYYLDYFRKKGVDNFLHLTAGKHNHEMYWFEIKLSWHFFLLFIRSQRFFASPLDYDYYYCWRCCCSHWAILHDPSHQGEKERMSGISFFKQNQSNITRSSQFGWSNEKKNNIWWLSEGASQSERAQHLTQSSKRTQTHTDFFLTTQFEWTKTPAPWFSDFPSPTHKQNKTEHTTSHTNTQTFAYIFLNLLREKESERACIQFTSLIVIIGELEILSSNQKRARHSCGE